MATAQRHMDISDLFLEHAEEEFHKGDLLQAAEKAWGSVAHCVSGIARERGWPLGTHQHLIRNAHRLISRDKLHEPQRRLLLRSLEALHANFYQEFMLPESVREGIDDARQMVGILKELANRQPAS